MPQVKKPTALKQLQGTANDHPGRQNQDQPIPPRGIGPPNKVLTGMEKEIWDEVVGISYAGVLGEADRIALEMMCRLISEMRTNFEEMTAAKITQLSALLGRFGMTPSDRTKIVIPKSKNANAFEGM